MSTSVAHIHCLQKVQSFVDAVSARGRARQRGGEHRLVLQIQAAFVGNMKT